MVARLSPLFDASPIAHDAWCSTSARSPRSSRRPSGSCRTTSSASSPIRPARSSATCSWRSGQGSTRRAFSTSSRTPSSRRCCSSAPARSSTRCTTSRTCGRWAGSRHKIPITYWMMLIGTFALTGLGIPGTPLGFAGFFSKDAIIEAAYGGGRQPRRLRLLGAGHRGRHDQLLLLPPDLHDFPRQAAQGRRPSRSASPEFSHTEPSTSAIRCRTTIPARTSSTTPTRMRTRARNLMLVPLYMLAAGAVLAGVLFAGKFMGQPRADCAVLQGRRSVVTERHRSGARRPFWVGCGGDDRDADRASPSPGTCTSARPGDAEAPRRAESRPLPVPAEQAGTSTSSTT